MELRCPDCCSPEVCSESAITDQWRCRNCRSTFQRGSAYARFEEVNLASGFRTADFDLFSFDEIRAEAHLSDGHGALVAASPFSDPDELHHLLEDAFTSGSILSIAKHARIAVYPASLSEPDPVLAVDLGNATRLLGARMDLDQRAGENPVTFTLRFLREAAQSANSLARAHLAERVCLDLIAAFLCQPDPFGSDDALDTLVDLLRDAGRSIPGAKP